MAFSFNVLTSNPSVFSFISHTSGILKFSPSSRFQGDDNLSEIFFQDFCDTVSALQ